MTQSPQSTDRGHVLVSTLSPGALFDVAFILFVYKCDLSLFHVSLPLSVCFFSLP